MNKIIVSISILLLSTSLITSCGGQKEASTSSEESSVNEEVATTVEKSENEESTENEKSTTEKIEAKAKEVNDKVVEKVNEGKEASRPLLNKMKGKIKETLEKKETN